MSGGQAPTAGTAPALASALVPAPTDRCPRCGGSFHCGMADATPCPCTQLTLDAHALMLLRQRHAGCLCGRCLAALAAGEPA